MSGKNRIKITPGMQVLIAMKKDQRAGKTTKGAVKDILTKSQTHPHWIKVRMAQPRNNRFICHLRKMMIIYLHFNQGEEKNGKAKRRQKGCEKEAGKNH